jgi:hypothetical protein
MVDRSGPSRRAKVFGRSIAGIAGSNPAEGMDVFSCVLAA